MNFDVNALVDSLGILSNPMKELVVRSAEQSVRAGIVGSWVCLIILGILIILSSIYLIHIKKKTNKKDIEDFEFLSIVIISLFLSVMIFIFIFTLYELIGNYIAPDYYMLKNISKLLIKG